MDAPCILPTTNSGGRVVCTQRSHRLEPLPELRRTDRRFLVTALPLSLLENGVCNSQDPTAAWGGARTRGRARFAWAGGRLGSAGRAHPPSERRCSPLFSPFRSPHQSYQVCFSLVPRKDLCSNKKKNLRSFLIPDTLFTAQSIAQRIKFPKTRR